MKTSLVPTGGAGGQRAARLRQASDTMEMGLSNLGTDERKTRTGYKDQMKKKAFDLIAHAASNLNLHDSVVGRAQELFANFRDEREFVQKFDAVVRRQRPTVPSTRLHLLMKWVVPFSILSRFGPRRDHVASTPSS